MGSLFFSSFPLPSSSRVFQLICLTFPYDNIFPMQDPDHMSRVPRLMDRPALDTTTTVDEGKGGFEHDGGEQEGRGSIDGETDDVSVMTDETSDEVAERQGNKKTKVGLL